MGQRMVDMELDNHDHHLAYRLLGVGSTDGQSIDRHQNTGRFLYRHAGSLMEEVTIACFAHAFPGSGKQMIDNTVGTKPAQFEIDCLVGQDAIEIKWRDATTDGDHVSKELARLTTIAAAGLRPVRLMYFEPQRQQARKIQGRLRESYLQSGGEYHSGDDAWIYVESRTTVDLRSVLEDLSSHLR